VIKAPTRLLNPLIDQSIIDQAMAEDPAAASAEWLGEFRDDISAFVTREAVDACISPDVFERSRVQSVNYAAFCDPSGGSSDSMTLAIGHSQLSEDKKRSISVLDAVREIRAPFNPDEAVADFATLLKTYGVRNVRGDRYAGEWVVSAFKKVGIEYRSSDLNKSEIYRDFSAAIEQRRSRPARQSAACLSVAEPGKAHGARWTRQHRPSPRRKRRFGECCMRRLGVSFVCP
jgi:hypothetical protein